MNLSRNSGNVTGTAVAASIVTAVMLSGGYEVKIDAVLDAEPGSGLLEFLPQRVKDDIHNSALQVIAAVASFFKTAPKLSGDRNR